VSINGANRLGSNSLVEILVFGRLAALNAIAYIESQSSRGTGGSASERLADAAQARVRELFNRPLGKETLAGVRQEMMDTMEKHAGIYRTGDELDEGARKLAQLRERYQRVPLHDKTNVYNTDLIQALELGCMLDCAEAVMVSAAARRESRGAHQRLDHTERDDTNFLKHSLAHYGGPTAPRVDYLDVVITKSQPGVRDYSGKHAGASVGLAS
jgi:fumarate reductase flavoprotein subunit